MLIKGNQFTKHFFNINHWTGKYDGNEEFSSNHLNGEYRLRVLLSVLFNCIIIHGHNPDDPIISTIISMHKDIRSLIYVPNGSNVDSCNLDADKAYYVLLYYTHTYIYIHIHIKANAHKQIQYKVKHHKLNKNSISFNTNITYHKVDYL